MNNPTTAPSATSRSIDPLVVDGAQALRTGLELARASQLTMLRLQLALHKSNRRTAMQALDNLLDIDAEMEGLAATLTGTPTRMVDDAALSGFIGLQKAAIAVEKHALTGGDGRSDAPSIESIAVAAPDDRAGADVPAQPLLSENEVEIGTPAGADLPAQSVLPDDDVESDARTGSRRWLYILAAAIVIVSIGCGLAAYLWPALPVTLQSIPARILPFTSGAG